MGDGKPQQIFDFVMDEKLNVVATLSLSLSRSIDLCIYSLSTGKLLGQTRFSGQNLSSMNMADSPRTGKVAINIARVSKFGEKSSVSICDINNTLSCTKEFQTDRMNQLEFFGNELLGASSDTESKNDCLVRLSSDGKRENSYCASDSGVHLFFGIVGKRYVVAFTGLTKYDRIREESTTTKSTYSVWEAEHKLPSATLDDPYGQDSDQRFGRIVTSENSAAFLLYKVHAKQLFVYRIISGEKGDRRVE